MKIKRVLQGTALTALAAAAWMGAGSTDASAEVTIDNVEIYYNGEISIYDEDSKEIMVSIVQPKNGVYQIRNWDVYEDGEAFVDLSKLNVAKDNYIAIMSDGSKPFFLKINKTDKPGKVDYKYNAEGIKLGSVDATELEYRTMNSGWDDVAWFGTNKKGEEGVHYNLDVDKYTYQGASLYMRVKSTLDIPVDDDGNFVESSEKLDDKSTKNTNEGCTVYEIGSLPSKEVKFNVKKQANGPSLSGDYAKNVIKSKADLSARIVDTNGNFYDFNETNGVTKAVSSGAVTSKSLKTADLEKITAKLPEGATVVLEVRTDVTDKKPASKWSRLELTVPETIPADKFSKGVTNGAIVTSGDAIRVNAAYTEKLGKNGAKSYPDIAIKNDASKGNVDVKVGEAGKASTLKPGKSVKYKKTGTDGNDLYVRVGGDKNDKKWAGAWTNIGKITFPADVAAATPTPSPTTAAK